jgi:hypothetical protein
MNQVKKYNGEGEFKASDKQGQFLNTTQVAYDVFTKDFSFLGQSDNDNWVTFTIPNTFTGEGPHKQKLYNGPVDWSVTARGEKLEFDSAEVNFRFETSDPQKLFGQIVFILKDKSTVIGDFKIKKIAD